MGANKTVALDWESVEPIIKKAYADTEDLVNTLHKMGTIIEGLTTSHNTKDSTMEAIGRTINEIHAKIKDTPEYVEELMKNLEKQSNEVLDLNADVARRIGEV